jgi:hypothetical protein
MRCPVSPTGRRRATQQGCCNPLSPLGLLAVLGRLQRYRFSAMLRHRLRRGALHLAQERRQCGRLDFYHGLLTPAWRSPGESVDEA